MSPRRTSLSARDPFVPAPSEPLPRAAEPSAPTAVLHRRRLLTGAFATAGAIAFTSAASACATAKPPQVAAVRTEELRYGNLPLQRGELRVPIESTPRPVVVLVHGGYWRTGFTRAAMAPISDDLTRLGYATWNLDYRTIGEDGGGWPGTPADVAAGIDHLATVGGTHNLALDRVVFLGHSAGAQLMMWAASRTGRNGQAAAPVLPKALVSLSGVLDLERASLGGAGDLATLGESTQSFLGGTPAQQPERYHGASPLKLVPYGVPTLLIHGSKDARVPPEHSRSFTDAATRAGDSPTYVELTNADHFDVIRVDRRWWDEVIRWLPSVIGSP